MRKITISILALLALPMVAQAGSRPCPCKYSFEEGSEKKVLLLSYNKGGRSFCSVQKCVAENGPNQSVQLKAPLYACEQEDTIMIPLNDGSIVKWFIAFDNTIQSVTCDQDDQAIQSLIK